MIQMLILAALVYLGAKAPRLRWQPFAWMIVPSAIACWLQSAMKAKGLAALGEDGAALFEPRVILANWAFGLVLWSIAYLLGHGVGRLMRRKPPAE